MLESGTQRILLILVGNGVQARIGSVQVHAPIRVAACAPREAKRPKWEGKAMASWLGLSADAAAKQPRRSSGAQGPLALFAPRALSSAAGSVPGRHLFADGAARKRSRAVGSGDAALDAALAASRASSCEGAAKEANALAAALVESELSARADREARAREESAILERALALSAEIDPLDAL